MRGVLAVQLAGDRHHCPAGRHLRRGHPARALRRQRLDDLFGWLQEKYQPGDGGWLPFIFGCFAGAVPWIGVIIYTVAPGSTSGAEPPGFVSGIIVSLFLFFNVFALVQWLQYRPVGRFRDYLTGETAYIVLAG